VKRTTIYLPPELELALKREARRQQRSMVDLIREAVRAYLGAAGPRRPPGAGAFASGRADTANDVDAALGETRFGQQD
jgi:hypothetical protein